MKDLSKYSEIIIWGATFSPIDAEGTATSHGYAGDKLFNLLKKNGYEDKLIFFADSNEKLYDKKRFGREVKPPVEILKYPDALVIINSLSMKAIQNAMDYLHISNDCLIVPYYFYHGVLGHPYDNKMAQKHIISYRDKILQLYEISDERTKCYLDIIIELREKAIDDLYEKGFYNGTGESLEYFCDLQLAPRGDVTFIDIGAFEGESIEPVREFYSDRLKKCIAFEPDTNSMLELKKYIYQNKMEDKTDIYPYALGSEDKRIYFQETGSTSKQIEFGGVEVQQRRFDNIQDIQIIGEAMIKMDIEGGELDALKGMKNLIKERQPYLAICIYHKEADLYDVPSYIKSVCSDYRFFIRGGWHLECWAVPERHFQKENS